MAGAATLGLSGALSCSPTPCLWAASPALVYCRARAKVVPGRTCFPSGAGGLPACWAVYSITPGNSLTSVPAALLGSGGSQDDKPLLEEIPFLV